MEGPYRDLGSGFARLTGLEGARRGPSPITHVEDALLELLRNARDAGASRIFVASSLTARRFRTLTVIDDGRGIPDPYASLVFEPGVTTRHLDPVPDPTSRTASRHGAGLALYHLKLASVSAEVLSPSSPTAIQATFDTQTIPERTLQSASRPSKTNLLATAEAFARKSPTTTTHFASPASILATLIRNRIIPQNGSSREIQREAAAVGLALSSRTVQRVIGGQVLQSEPLSADKDMRETTSIKNRKKVGSGGAVLPVGEEEKAQIAAILVRAARAGYVEVDELKVESRPGEILLKARVYEPEEEYE